ncbi:hypothetical protein Syun_030569 [Stephania yunnanensis]|uniref:Uncharacterized protein n=1 Tax=Stephania yunnanensis TaxID=152371 RepID=A0AAP0DU73_9MAGN
MKIPNTSNRKNEGKRLHRMTNRTTQVSRHFFKHIGGNMKNSSRCRPQQDCHKK